MRRRRRSAELAPPLYSARRPARVGAEYYHSSLLEPILAPSREGAGVAPWLHSPVQFTPSSPAPFPVLLGFWVWEPAPHARLLLLHRPACSALSCCWPCGCYECESSKSWCTPALYHFAPRKLRSCPLTMSNALFTLFALVSLQVAMRRAHPDYVHSATIPIFLWAKEAQGISDSQPSLWLLHNVNLAQTLVIDSPRCRDILEQFYQIFHNALFAAASSAFRHPAYAWQAQHG